MFASTWLPKSARDELLELEELCTLAGIWGRRPSFVDSSGDIVVGFGSDCEKKHVQPVLGEIDVIFSVGKACKIECCLLLMQRAKNKVLQR